jgi:hypothetical protein
LLDGGQSRLADVAKAASFIRNRRNAISSVRVPVQR